MTTFLSLAIVSILAVVVTSSAFATPAIRAVPESPRPGEVIFLTLAPEHELTRASCSWRGKSYDLLPFGDGYRVLLPVPAGAKPGGCRAVVWWRYANGEAGKQEVRLQVKARRFGIQRLTLSTSQERKYTQAQLLPHARRKGGTGKRVERHH